MKSAPARAPLAALATGLALVAGLLVPTAASADTAPRAGVPDTVSTDALPTVQINGVVWSQIVVGDTVYAAGRFSQARPAGVKKGRTGEDGRVARYNMLAFDITTGELKTGFKPRFNSEVRALAASTDGRRIYAVGNFTAVNGVRHTRIAAIDATTGRNERFSGSLNAMGLAVAVHKGTVYAGGQFTSASGAKRTRLAAFSASTGALKAWRPSANRAVQALAVSPSGGSVVAGGRFNSVNGRTAKGSVRVDGGSGRTLLPWSVNRTVENNGPDAAVYSLSSDGRYVYMSGYSYHPVTTQKRLEGLVSVSWKTGRVHWIEDCHGDTYSSVPIGDVVYTASHAHDCRTIGGFKQTRPVRYNHALAFTRAATHTLQHQPRAKYTDYGGKPAPSLLNWYPAFANGTYTGMSQAAWSVTGDSRYVVYGGEFPTVNGARQQGLVRFAIPRLAPNLDGPRLSGDDMRPKLTATTGTVTATVKADFDRDNQYLTYRLYRDPAPGVAFADQVPVATATVGSKYYWSRPTVTVKDRGVPAGTHSYRIVVSDPFGNTAVGSSRTITAK